MFYATCLATKKLLSVTCTLQKTFRFFLLLQLRQEVELGCTFYNDCSNGKHARLNVLVYVTTGNLNHNFVPQIVARKGYVTLHSFCATSLQWPVAQTPQSVT